MRALRLALSACLIFLPFLTEPALAQAAPAAANVVATCGTPNSTYGVGTNKALTQDTTGTLCSEAGGGGGGGAPNYGPNAVGTAATHPPIIVGGTADATGTGTVQVQKVDSSGNAYTSATVTLSALPTGAATSANQPTNAAQGSTTSGQTGPLIQGAVTTSAPSYTTAQTSPISLDTAGNVRDVEKNSASILSAIQAAIPAGTNVIGFTTNDPCGQATKLGASINLTASGQVITGTASKKTYICSIDLVSATAQNIALVEGTGTTCATNIFGLAGGTTAATGWNLAANGGLTKGSGVGTVYSPSADTNATAANVCLLLSSTGQTSGQITFVQQ